MKNWVSILCCILVVLTVFSCASAFAELTFVTGGTSGVYYKYGSVLAQFVTDNSDVVVKAAEGSGSMANIDCLASGAAQLGMVQGDIACYAYNGTRIYAENPVTSIKALAALYGEVVQIVTCCPDIQSIDDLRGKKVAIGFEGSAVYYNAIDLLAAYDMTEADIIAENLSFGMASEALIEGTLDAAITIASVPNIAVASLCADNGAHLIDVDAAHIAKLQKCSGAYDSYTIPVGTYEGIRTNITTLAVKAIIIANDDVTDEEAYTIVSTIFENTDAISAAYDKGAELNIEYASECGLPYHAGAAKYFEEKRKPDDPSDEHYITLSDDMIVINDEAFFGDTSIESVIIPDSTTTIGARAFKGCTNLATIYIPSSVETIGSDAFANCGPALTIITDSESSSAVSYAKANGIAYKVETR